MPNDCKEILKNGVYESHIQTRTGNVEKDYKHYFSSDEFRKDFKDFKFKFGVETILDAVPFKLNSGADDSKINDFQKKVRESNSFTISETFFEQSIHSIPNKAIIDAWKDCMIQSFGFSIKNEVIGNSVIFTLKYNNFGNVNLPTLQEISIVGGVIKSRTKKDGEKIEVNEDVAVVCTFSDDEILITFDTDFTPVTEFAERSNKRKSNDGNPLGTIINSFLNWEEFQKTTENNKYTENGLWNRKSSFWSPCDGRNVNGSDFSNLTNNDNVPDARGLFLRGLNIFDRFETDNAINSASDNHRDPQLNRVRGEFQEDEFKSHTHIGNMKCGAEPMGQFARSSMAAGGTGQIDATWTTSDLVNRTGGYETRPKNISVYYYIKINS